MNKLSRDDLWSLESYSDRRNEFRAEVMRHKKNRQVALGDNARLYFEDRKTIQYQIQEMLRIERVFDAAGIQEELDAYNPLIPDGPNLKATFMLEYDNPDERRQQLSQLIDIEKTVYILVDDSAPVYPIADEDLKREDGSKTSAVHFLRFELPNQVRAAIKNGSDIKIGVDHPNYTLTATAIALNVRDALAVDLQ